MKETQIYSNEGPCPFPRGDNNENVNIYIVEILKSSSPELQGQFKPDLAQSILQVCSNEGQALFPGEIITK